MQNTIDYLKKAADGFFNPYKNNLDILLVGSYARNEKISQISDLDLIFYFKKNNLDVIDLDNIKKFLDFILSNDLELSPQIYSQSDLTLISPVLMLNYLIDGKLIYGSDILKIFHNFLGMYDYAELQNNATKRIILKRYFCRSIYVNKKKNETDIFVLAKNVIYAAKNILFIADFNTKTGTKFCKIVRMMLKSDKINLQSKKTVNTALKILTKNAYLSSGKKRDFAKDAMAFLEKFEYILPDKPNLI